MSRVLFITPKQPSTNPRMRKAADALASAGHEVHVLYAYNADWAKEADEEIFAQAAWTHERIGGDPHEEPITYHLGRFQRRLSAALGRLEPSYCRSLKQFIKAGLRWHPDLVIGHNPGALFPTYEIARQLQVPSLFDAEDYHRGESESDSTNDSVAQLEDRWLPKMSAVTTAAPLITQAYQALYPDQHFVTINNTFPKSIRTISPETTGPLKLIWFSQVLGVDRGVQPFIQSIQDYSNPEVHLTLVGHPTNEMATYLDELRRKSPIEVDVLPPMKETQLFEILHHHHVGLALEPGFSRNNMIARSNKLFSYVVSGCHILATKTEAQVDFSTEYEVSMDFIDLDSSTSIQDTIDYLLSNRETLRNGQLNNWQLGQAKLNWETESVQLIELVKSVLG